MLGTEPGCGVWLQRARGQGEEEGRKERMASRPCCTLSVPTEIAGNWVWMLTPHPTLDVTSWWKFALRPLKED